MARFIIQHTYKQGPEVFWKSMQDLVSNPAAAAPLADEMIKIGATPIVTYNNYVHGRTDGFCCVWEAETAEQVTAALRLLGIDQTLNNDIQRVDEFQWAPFMEALLKERSPA